jgi:hypothetical protein
VVVVVIETIKFKKLFENFLSSNYDFRNPIPNNIFSQPRIYYQRIKLRGWDNYTNSRVEWMPINRCFPFLNVIKGIILKLLCLCLSPSVTFRRTTTTNKVTNISDPMLTAASIKDDPTKVKTQIFPTNNFSYFLLWLFYLHSFLLHQMKYVYSTMIPTDGTQLHLSISTLCLKSNN